MPRSQYQRHTYHCADSSAGSSWAVAAPHVSASSMIQPASAGASVERRIHHADLEAERVAFVAVFDLALAVQNLSTDAEALEQLIDHVAARVDRVVVRVTGLSAGVLQVCVAEHRGRPPALCPLVGECEQAARIVERHEIAVAVECGIAVDEAGVVAHAPDALPIDAHRDQGIPFGRMDGGGQVDAPAEHALITHGGFLPADRAEAGSE